MRAAAGEIGPPSTLAWFQTELREYFIFGVIKDLLLVNPSDLFIYLVHTNEAFRRVKCFELCPRS